MVCIERIESKKRPKCRPEDPEGNPPTQTLDMYGSIISKNINLVKNLRLFSAKSWI